MSYRAHIDSLISFKEKWKNLTVNKIPSEIELEKCSSITFQSRQQLSSNTKQIKETHHGYIPYSIGFELLEQYQKEIERIYEISQNNESIIVELFSDIANFDDPMDIINTMNNIIESIPDFELKTKEITELISQLRKEREYIEKLKDEKANLALDFHNQIELAVHKISIFNEASPMSLNDIKIVEQRANQKENDYLSKKQVRDELKMQLESKQDQFEQVENNRREQVELLKNELYEVELSLKDAKMRQSDSQFLNEISTLKNDIENIKDRINETESKIMNTLTSINTLNDQMESKKKELDKETNLLQAMISKSSSLIAQLPSQYEFEKSKKELLRLKQTVVTDYDIDNGKKILAEMQSERDSLENQVTENNQIITNMKKQISELKAFVDKTIELAPISSNVGQLKLQIKTLTNSINDTNEQIRQMNERLNQEKLKQDNQDRLSKIVPKYQNRNETDRYMMILIDSKPARLSLISIIIIVHFYIMIAFFKK